MYTAHDKPDVVKRVEADLEAIVETVRSLDPYLHSLILTGGFSRGEGSIVDGKAQNDYDIVALRNLRLPPVSYESMEKTLEQKLGVHVDLAPVAVWRLPWVSHSIFWYETAIFGKVLYGPNVLDRIPIRRAQLLDPTEGLRLLVNRAAGLLLATGSQDPEAHRLQAAKAFLAAVDVHLLARGLFIAGQAARWGHYLELRLAMNAPHLLRPVATWLDWAYQYKVDAANAPFADPTSAWRVARRTLLETIPVALAFAGLDSLEAYGRRDTIADRLYYFRHTPGLPGANRFVANPTGKVRVATLGMLDAAPEGSVPPQATKNALADFGTLEGDPLSLLEQLRHATLQ